MSVWKAMKYTDAPPRRNFCVGCAFWLAFFCFRNSYDFGHTQSTKWGCFGGTCMMYDVWCMMRCMAACMGMANIRSLWVIDSFLSLFHPFDVDVLLTSSLADYLPLPHSHEYPRNACLLGWGVPLEDTIIHVLDSRNVGGRGEGHRSTRFIVMMYWCSSSLHFFLSFEHHNSRVRFKKRRWFGRRKS